MFDVYLSSGRKTRFVQGRDDGMLARVAVQSVVKGWRRSGEVKRAVIEQLGN